MEVKSFDSINEIDQKEWDSIVDNNHIINSYDYLRAVEDAKLNDYRYKYFLFFENNEIIANASCFIISYNLDFFLKGPIEDFINKIRIKHTNFLKVKSIECGPTTSAGTSIIIKDDKFSEEVLVLLNKELMDLSKKVKAFFILIRDFDVYQQLIYNKFFNLGYKYFMNFYNTYFENKYTNFEDYLYYLKTERKRETKKNLNDFYSQGGSVERINDFSKYSNELSELWFNVYKNSEDYQREILNIKYFEYMDYYLKDKSFVLLFKIGNKIIAFGLIYEYKDSLNAVYCGINYDYIQKYHIYFVLYYKTIEEGIRLKKKWVEFGLTTYDIKIKLGIILVPIFAYVKSKNLFLTNLLSFFLNISAKRKYKLIHPFHQDLDNKEILKNNIYAIYKNIKFIINTYNNNNQTFLLKTDKVVIKKKKITIIIKPPNNFAFKIKIKILENKLIENQTELLVKVDNVNIDFLYLFNHFINNYKF